MSEHNRSNYIYENAHHYIFSMYHRGFHRNHVITHKFDETLKNLKFVKETKN